MDNLTKDQRHLNMSHIKSKNTTIEVKVRKYLFSKGFRYRINVKTLQGKPDIVLKKYNTVIFINGCFWHRHGCKLSTMPKTNQEYWIKKFEANVANDEENYKKLRNEGWNVEILWECELKDDFEMVMNQLIENIIEIKAANI